MSEPQEREPATSTPEQPVQATDEPVLVADEPGSVDEPGTADEPAAGTTAGPGGRARRLVLRTALLLVPVLLAVAAVVLLDRTRDAATVSAYYRPSSAPLEAARVASRALFSYDHRRLDEDFAAGAALSTGEFREEYSRTTAAVVRDVAERYDAVVVAEPVVAGVAAAEPGRVTAVVFLNQTTTSTETDGPQVDQSRVRMVLVERDGEWLVSGVEAL